MANNRVQVKRTSTSGRTPNTTGSYATNSQYISAGELALNMADGILYTSNGSAVIEIGANNVNQRITNSISIDNNKSLRFQTVNTSAYVGLRQQSDDNFVLYTTNTAYGERAVWSIFANSITSNISFSVPAHFNANVGIATGAAIYANGGPGTSGQVLSSNGSAVYWATPGAASVNVSAQYNWTNLHTFSANVSFTGNGIGLTTNTAAIYLGGLDDNNWKLGRNTGATTKWRYTNNTIDIITANSNLEGFAIGLISGNSYFETGYLGTYIASNVTIGNASSNSTINSTAFSGSANNTSYLNGQLASYYTNATNITTGTLPYAQIPANVINTTAAFTRTGITTFSANIVLGSSGLSANGSFGTAGHVLHSNGTATYWAVDDNTGGTVTSVATGNGLTGGTITSTGTVSVLANTGIVANTTGLYVNSAYIGTLSANNTTYVNGKTEGNLNVNNSLTSNTASYLGNSSGTTANFISWITGNSATAYSNAVSYTDSKILTANSDITSNAATAYSNAVSYVDGLKLDSVTNTSITYIPVANTVKNAYDRAIDANTRAASAQSAAVSAYTNAVSYTDSKIATANSAITGNAATAYSNATTFASNATNITSGTLTYSIIPANIVNTTANFTISGIHTHTANIVVGNSSVNATVFANASGVYFTGTSYNANNADLLDGQHGSYYAANSLLSNYAPLAGATFSGDVTVNANLVVTGTTVTLNTATLDVKDKNITVAKGSTAAASDGSGITVDGANVGWYYTYSSNTWTSNVGITPSANVSFDIGSSSLNWRTIFANSITAVNVSGNGSSITSVNAIALGGKTEGNLNVNSALTSNNSSFLGGTSAASYALLASPTFTGTLSATNVTVSANLTVAAAGELILTSGAGLYANGGLGTTGHVLHSNGSSVYWAEDDQGVTSVATGNGLTGGTITSTGTVSVLANNGITANTTGLFVTSGTGTVVNATGVHVNSTYIGTLSANNASFLGGTAASGYQTTAGLSANVATLTSNNSTFSYGKTEGNLNVNSALTSNNSSFLGGTAAASYQLNSTLNANIASYLPTYTGVVNASSFTIGSSVTANSTTTKTPVLFLDRITSAARGINWYSTTFTAWQEYMSPAGSNQGWTGTVTAPSGTYVTSWARRSFIENTAGYGWTWEAGGSTTTTPSIVAELASATGNFRTVGAVNAASLYATTNTSTFGTAAYIVANGNIGISNTAPTEKLYVQGNIKSSGYIDSDLAFRGQASDTASVPSFTWTGETNTGMFRPAANIIGFSTGGSERVRIDASGNVGIGTTSSTYKLQVNGSFAATTKSFVIDHPTKPDMKLRYGSLEGPENGVYVRGKIEGNVIELPDYWAGLVDEDSITVNLTAIGRVQDLYVVEISNNKVHIDTSDHTKPNCYYTVYGERKDVEKLVVEFDA
jgi:hypothetical protein